MLSRPAMRPDSFWDYGAF